MYKMYTILLMGLGVLGDLPVYGWNIAIENQTDNDLHCQVLPHMDLGSGSAASRLPFNMIMVPAKKNSQFQLPVWQENLNPYIVLVIVPEKKPMSWLVKLKAQSQLKIVSEDANQICLYARIRNETWAKISSK